MNTKKGKMNKRFLRNKYQNEFNKLIEISILKVKYYVLASSGFSKKSQIRKFSHIL